MIETMTSKERLAALKKRMPLDRIPVLAYAGAYTARLAGLDIKTFYTDIDKSVKVQRLAKALHGYDDDIGYGWADWGGWEFGGEIRFPETEQECAPRTIRNPVTKPSDVDKLKIRDIRTAGMVPNLMALNRIVTAEGSPAKIKAGSVTSIVAGIIGKERLMRWFLKEPDAVRVVYEKATQFLLELADMVLDEFGGKASASISAPMDSNNLISGDIFRSFAFPWLKKINLHLMERGVNSFKVHICGNHRKNIHYWAELPWPPRTIFSIGEMDINEVAQVFGKKHIIAGNVNTSILAVGTYDDVLEDSRRAIEQGKDLPGGFILMPACEMPVNTPPLNVHAMVQAARDFGAYN